MVASRPAPEAAAKAARNRLSELADTPTATLVSGCGGCSQHLGQHAGGTGQGHIDRGLPQRECVTGTGPQQSLGQTGNGYGLGFGSDMSSATLDNSGTIASEQSVGVILRINSPGGSPVQAGLINDEIERLRAKYPTKPLYAVVEEVCASGGYYIAAASTRASCYSRCRQR